MKDHVTKSALLSGAQESSPFVHYTGTWEREERGLIEEAVQDVETKLAEKATPVLGKPWVCSRYPGAARTLYMAHRAQWMKKVLTAHSAGELAQRIRQRLP